MTDREIVELLEKDYGITCSRSAAKYLKDITLWELWDIIAPVYICFRDNLDKNYYTTHTIMDKALRFRRVITT